MSEKKMAKNKKVLVTGFDPFDGDAVNPSAELLVWLRDKEFDFEVKTLQLPVSFQKCFVILEKEIKFSNPSHVILTGLAKKRIELTVERIGINWMDARIPDNEGAQPLSQKILPEGADGLFSTLPVEQVIAAANAAGCPTKLSTSAGEYVCNYLLYRFLSAHPKLPGTFLHLPGASDYERVYEGIKAIVEVL
jgi:pyroglutamyl-peptidase